MPVAHTAGQHDHLNRHNGFKRYSPRTEPCRQGLNIIDRNELLNQALGHAKGWSQQDTLQHWRSMSEDLEETHVTALLNGRLVGSLGRQRGVH